MAIDMTPEQREIGKTNFQRVVGQLADHAEEEKKKNGGVTRRDFMKGLLATGAALPVSAAAYFGYAHDKMQGRPVKAGLIGAGDEGGVLVGAHNPAFLEFVAYSDIRPYNQKRIFKGEGPSSPRKGFDRIYGKGASKIQLYEDYRELLKDKDIEAVVIALPLNLHAPVAIEAMKAGKHVLCEKLMAWNISQCKEMIKVAQETDRILSIGHQRHYSMLYAHALEVMNSGVLGDVKYIRALWHRNNTWPLLDANGKEQRNKDGSLILRDSWKPPIRPEDKAALEDKVRKYGFKSMEELVRWRLYERTGAGLMAELGSHQLDACSIFLGKVHPLAVSGLSGKFFYRDDREVEDHVYVTFEFPGKKYYAGNDDEPNAVKQKRGAIQDKNDIVVVTYSSINTNAFEPYGECVMGTRGTMVVESEQNVMLYTEKNPNLRQAGSNRALNVQLGSAGGGQAILDSSGSSGPGAAAAVTVGQASMGSGPPSRGYREEMEHFAYCIRMSNEGANKDDRPKPRCGGTAAMADAIIALTANRAMHGTKQNPVPERVVFSPDWFDPTNPAVPDGDRVYEEVKG